jgi:hypothetical protein
MQRLGERLYYFLPDLHVPNNNGFPRKQRAKARRNNRTDLARRPILQNVMRGAGYWPAQV